MKNRVLALVLTLLLALPLSLFSSCGKEFSYMTADLSKYVEISPTAYENMQVEIKLDKVTDTAVEEAINKVRVSHKNTTPENSGGCRRDLPMTLGDVVQIFYRGYQYEGESKVDLSGTCNYDSDVASLELGSGTFISGFETGLLGKIPQDYGTFRARSSGDSIYEGDTVVFSYSAIFPDEVAYEKTAELVLTSASKSAIDAQYGTGFYDYLKTLKMGGSDNGKTFSIGNDSVDYISITVNAVYQIKGSPMTVTTYFPMDYSSSDLAGQTVYFDVYFDAAAHGAIIYTTPDLDDTFITESLALTEDKLAEYAGDTLVEKYRAMVRQALETTYEEEYTSAVYDALFEQLVAIATIKKVPESKVKEEYESLMTSMKNDYQTYCDYYGSDTDFSTFASAMTGLSEVGDYQSVLRATAENTVKEKLVFYAVARGTNVIPSDEELSPLRESIIDEFLNSYLDSYSEYDRENFDSDEAYQTAIEELRATMIDYYTEEYFWESARYRVAMKEMQKKVSVTQLGRGADR